MMRTVTISLTVLACFTSVAFSENASSQRWVVIDQVVSGDVPSISLLTEDDTHGSTTLVYETHGECEADVFERFSKFENFTHMSHPGFYHLAFTFGVVFVVFNTHSA